MFNSPQSSTTKVHILQPKIDPETFAELYSLVDPVTQHITSNSNPLHFEFSPDPSDADVIVTNIRMRKRFERHLDWNIAVGEMIDLSFISPTLQFQ